MRLFIVAFLANFMALFSPLALADGGSNTMGISKYDIETREKYVNEAKEAPSFLDAVFLINYYNREVKAYGPHPKLSDILPEEVFEEYSETEYMRSLRKANFLLQRTTYVGDAAHRSQNTELYKAAIARMKSENPGFSERSYNLATHSSWVKMR